MTSARRLYAAAALSVVAAAVATVMAAAPEPGYSASVTPGLIARYEQRFGAGVRGRIADWKGFIRATAGQPPTGAGEPGLLDPVNSFFNRVPASTDVLLWNAVEYWATPAETLSINGADCEDYAIAKYFALKELGIPATRLRMIYARQAGTPEAHMVLAYYAEPHADPLILDILDGTIRPASQRKDLTPVYSFNDDDLVLVQPGQAPVRVANYSNRKWKELLEKLRFELDQ